jgi:hypothetical protein
MAWFSLAMYATCSAGIISIENQEPPIISAHNPAAIEDPCRTPLLQVPKLQQATIFIIS